IYIQMFSFMKLNITYFVTHFFFQAEDGIRDFHVTGVQTCALPILFHGSGMPSAIRNSLSPWPVMPLPWNTAANMMCRMTGPAKTPGVFIATDPVWCDCREPPRLSPAPSPCESAGSH